ncbi:hypothetical protein B9G69_009775 [Bdellovibrio sp. SKB1291214]|uniref:hypothetical protein n=1 Tax=Bdellovibrio sp. SKB1291214 TaxID=1732569 RepID=UPI000B519092|nr:hypothetical protein [Bdellovibrio sp. SKB1291214]UYL07333.1 hypothetical protein B9G69_009775 [Bdellovibrio sp. SKB1291214]
MATPNANPSFTGLHQGEATNNHVDENEILVDKDETSKVDVKNLKRAMKNTDRSFDTLEDLPPDFIRGEIDVLDQMNMAAEALDSSLRGIPDRSSQDSPRGELGSSFKNTPGGLEEVEAKTDEYLASHGLKKKTKRSH